MSDLRVHPSTTLAKLTVAFAAILSGIVFYYGHNLKDRYWMVAFVVPGAIAASAIGKIVASSHTYIELAGDRLKYESGMLSKTSRSVPVTKVQDVAVEQSIGQRILGLGNLTVLTAGESKLTIENIQGPRDVAEKILARVGESNSRKQFQ